MDLYGDDHLERAVTELGEPEALFRVGRGRFLAKLALGVLLLIYGVVANYFWWVHGPATFGHFEILLLLLPPLSGVSLLLHMYRNRGLFVLVYPTGLLRLRHGEVDSFPWNEIESVKLRVQRAETAQFARENGVVRACWLTPDIPTFKLWDAGLSVTRTDGTEANFGAALSDYEQLAIEVQKRSFAALWPRLRDQFLSGDRVEFGELEVSPAGLSHAGKLLRWRDLKELSVAQGKLSIKQSGKWLPWALVDMASVPNPHLLFALVEEIRRAPFLPPEEPKLPAAEQHSTE